MFIIYPTETEPWDWNDVLSSKISFSTAVLFRDNTLIRCLSHMERCSVPNLAHKKSRSNNTTHTHIRRTKLTRIQTNKATKSMENLIITFLVLLWACSAADETSPNLRGRELMQVVKKIVLRSSCLR